MSRADNLKRTSRIHRGVRLVIQILFFILAPGFFAAAFNGVKYIFQQLGASAPLELTGFLAMLLVILAFTVVFGRFFCGYACAFGTLGDVLFGVFDFLRSKTPIPHVVFPDRLVRALSLIKYFILGAICLLCFFGIWSAISGYSPWVSFAGIVAGSLDGIAIGSFIALGLVVILMILRERAFCQFLCPLGALFALLPVFGCSTFTRCKRACIPSCGRCKQSCLVDIWPDEGLRQGECISCGRCADICPISNIDLLSFEKLPAGTSDETPSELRKRRMSRWSICGTEIWFVVAKAVVLLLLFWLLGATRYLPSFVG